jgi:DHA1 family tetracycline resistance protein-like MFS transporter
MISLSSFISSQLALLRELPRSAKVAVFLFFTAGFADGVLIPFFALWAQREGGVPTAHIGLLLGCYAGGELLATPFLGGIADRVGRRPTLLISTLGVGLGFGLLYLTSGAWASAAALLLIGVFESVLHPTAATVIADVTPADGNARARFALARMASGVGAVCGPALGAWLVRWSLGLVFVGAALSLLLGALAVATLLPETRPSGSSAEDDDNDDDSVLALGAALRDPRLAALLLPVLLLQVSSSWIESVLPLAATGAGTLTPSGVGLLFAYAGVFGVCCQLPILHATARLAGSSLVLASGLLLTLAFGSLLTDMALPFLVVAVTWLASAQMLVGPLTQAFVNELAPERARATYMAALSVVNDLRDAAGPAVGTYLFALSASLPWVVGMPVTLGATAALAVAVRRHETIHARPSQ